MTKSFDALPQTDASREADDEFPSRLTLEDGKHASVGITLLLFKLAALYTAVAVPALVLQRPSFDHLGASIVLASCLIPASAIDIREFRLPDLLMATLAISGLAISQILGLDSVGERLLSGAAGFASLFAVAMIYRQIRRHDGLGLGDAKLMGAAGVWLGLEALPIMLLVACILALVALVVISQRGQKVTLKTKIPFGPFLAIATWLLWVYGGPIALV